MYKVEVASKNDYRFTAQAKGASFDIDAKGKEGMTPPDVLLASLGSCVGVYIRKYAEGAKLDVGEFCITVESDLGTESPYCFRQIKVSVDLKNALLDDRRKKALLDFIKNCPIHNTLKTAPDIEISLKP